MHKVAIVYHHIALYRRAVFEELCQSKELDIFVYADNKTHNDSLVLVTSDGEGGAMSGLLPRRMIQTKNVWILKRLLWQGRIVKDVFADRYDAYVFLGSFQFVSTWLAASWARLRGKPVLFWTIGVQRDEWGVRRLLRRLFYRIPDQLLLYGTWARNILLTWGFKKDAFEIIYNSLDQNAIEVVYQRLRSGAVANPISTLVRESTEAPLPAYFVCLGRLIPKKRFELAVAALALLRDQGRDAHLVIIGGGNEEARLRAMVGELALQGRCHLLGPSHQEEVLGPWLYYSLACVMPGQVGLSSVHAHSYGTAVISHDNWDQHSPEFEIVEPGLSGLIFKYDSAASLAAVMAQVLDGALDPLACAAYARKRIEEDYNPRVQAERIVSALKRQLALKA